MAAEITLNVRTNDNGTLDTLKQIEEVAKRLNSTTVTVNINTAGGTMAGSAQQVGKDLMLLQNAVSDFSSEQQNAANATQNFTQLQKLSTVAVNAGTSATNAASGSAKKLNIDLGDLGKSAKKTGDSLASNIAKFTKWMIIGNVISGIKRTFTNAIAEMKAVDTSMVTIQKVTGATKQEMDALGDSAYKTAAQLGSTASDYLDSVAEFAKAGYGDAAKDLGELAITAAKVGDTNQQVATQFLLSVDAAYKYGGSVTSLTSVLDGANEIGNKYATSVEKMAEGLGKIAPVAAQAGVGVDELTAGIGTITAVTQRSGTEAATAMRALFLNIIGDTKTEIADGATWTAGEIEGLRDVLRTYAPEVVAAADATGELINPMKAIGALAQSMEDGLLTKQALMSMVSDIGGKLRTSQLLALIQNWDMYESMLQTYATSAGSAAKEYAIYLDSWEAKTAKLSATWTEFVASSNFDEFAKDLIDGASSALEFAQSIGGILPILEKLIGVVLVLKSASIGKSVENMFAGAKAQSFLKIMGLSSEGLSIKVASFVSSVGLAIQAISMLNMAMAAIADADDKRYEKSKEQADESAEEAENLKSLIDNYKKVEASDASGTEKLEQKKAIQKEIISLVGAEAANANIVNGGYTETLGILDEILKKKQEIAMEDAKSQYEEAKRNSQRTALDYLLDSGEMYDTNSLWGLTRAVTIDAVEMAIRSSQISKILGEDVINPMIAESKDFTAKDIATLYDVWTEQAERAGFSQTTAYDIALDRGNHFKTLAANVRESYEAVANMAAEYANITDAAGLQEYLNTVEQSTELTDEQKQAYKEAALVMYSDFVPALESVGDASETFSSRIKDAFSDAATEISTAAESIKSEASDSANALSDLYDAFAEAAGKGYYNSNAFKSGASALFGTEILSMEDYPQFMREAAERGLDAYFSAIKDGDYSEAGRALFENLGDAADNVFSISGDDGILASVEMLGDELVWTFKQGGESIDEFLAHMSDATGLSSTFWASFIQSLGMYSSEIDKYIEGTEDSVPEDVTTTINVDGDEAIEGAKLIGEAIIAAIPTTLTTTIKTRFGGLLGGIGGFLSGLFGSNSSETESEASGTGFASGGATLVNELGPEIIRSGDRAFIANDGKPAIVNLNRGDQVFNADATKDIFDTGVIPSMALERGGGSSSSNGSDVAGGETSAFGRLPGTWGGATVNVDGDLNVTTPTDQGEPKPSSGGKKKSVSLDDVLSELEDYIDDVLDKAKEALDLQIKAIDAQIDELKKQREKDTTAKELEEKRLAVIEAEKDLLDAMSERTVRIYNAATGQWEWVRDEGAVKSAQESSDEAKKNLNDFLEELAYEAALDELEAQKDAAKEGYEQLEETWTDIKDTLIEIRDGAPRSIAEIIRDLAKTSGGTYTTDLNALFDAIAAYTANPLGSFDGGGIASGLGYMRKATSKDEVALSPELTAKILAPKSNAEFTAFASSLGLMFGAASRFSSTGGGGIVHNGGTSSTTYHRDTYINGVKIGSDMMQKPLSEVLSVLSLHANRNA